MPLVDDSSPDPAVAERDRIRHELNSPLTVILGRAQLLRRMLLRSALPELERGALLDGLATIEEASHVLATRIQALGCDTVDDRVHVDEAPEALERARRDRRV